MLEDDDFDQEGAREEEQELLTDEEAEETLREMFGGIEKPNKETSQFLTIPINLLRFKDDEYSDPQDSEKVVQRIAESIQKVGLLQPPVIVRTDWGYSVVAGRKRVRACQRLKFDEVTCIVREMSEIEQEQVALIENLCRVVYRGPAYDKAIARLRDLYLIVHPETEEGRAGGLAKNRPELERARPFAEVMSETEGVSKSTIQSAVKRGKTFTDEDRELFVRNHIPKGWQSKLAKLNSDEDRQKILDLVRSGVRFKKAGRQVRPDVFGEPKVWPLPKDSTQTETEGEPLTDSQWLASFESIRLKVNTPVFDMHAILYRRILDVLKDARSILFRYEKANQLKGFSGTINHLPAIIGRFLKTPHPSEWQVCGTCQGEAEPAAGCVGENCPNCGGIGFTMPPAHVGYWLRFGIKGYGKVKTKKDGESEE
jgi:ParB-like chromosome segregation protein Spo0J